MNGIYRKPRSGRRLLATGVMALMAPALAFLGTAHTSAAPAHPPTHKPLAAAVTNTFPVADGDGWQVWPHIGGSIVAYDACGDDGCRVTARDLSKKNSKPVTITPANSPAYMPGTDGKTVVWVDTRKATGGMTLNDPSNDLNIMGANLTSGKFFTVTTATKLQLHPEVSGNIVVWTDYRNAKTASDGDIYMYNIATGKESAVTTAKGSQDWPVTNGKVIVWQDYRNEPDPKGYNSDIYAYDIATKKEFAITKAKSAQLSPAISGNIVVWADWRNGQGDIYGYDLVKKKEFVVSKAPSMQIMPAISGNFVVWADYRNEPDPKGTNSDIYGIALDTGQEFPVAVADGSQGAPRISGNTVVWEDNPSGDLQNGDFDVQAATIDPDGTPDQGSQPTPTATAAATATPNSNNDNGDNGNNGNNDQPSPQATPIQPSGVAEPGVIKGRVTDMKGKPLPDVPITISGTSNAGERVYFDARTGADGRYSLHVPDGIYRIYGYYRMQYKGRTYRLPVWPVDNVDGTANYSKDGIVKDFIWRISGGTPEAADDPNKAVNYYGGYASIGDFAHFQLMHGDPFAPNQYFPDRSTIELTLTPDGPLFDGSKGQAILYKIPAEELAHWFIWDIPLGDYIATAQVIDSDGNRSPAHVASISMYNSGQKLPILSKASVQFLPTSDTSFYGAEIYILP